MPVGESGEMVRRENLPTPTSQKFLPNRENFTYNFCRAIPRSIKKFILPLVDGSVSVASVANLKCVTFSRKRRGMNGDTQHTYLPKWGAAGAANFDGGEGDET